MLLSSPVYNSEGCPFHTTISCLILYPLFPASMGSSLTLAGYPTHPCFRNTGVDDCFAISLTKLELTNTAKN
ncbi:unnamed protein product [Ixodes persulcatus]